MAQGPAGAWVARLGFVAFGLAVLWLAAGAARSWGRGAVWMHAAFSHVPWWEGAAFDPVEDLLHSVTATAMGFAFVFGVFLRLAQRWFGGAFAGGVGACARGLDREAARVDDVLCLDQGGRAVPRMHLYVSDEGAAELRARARGCGTSVSKLLAEIVTRDMQRGWPEGWLDRVAGAWPGPWPAVDDPPPDERRPL